MTNLKDYDKIFCERSQINNGPEYLLQKIVTEMWMNCQWEEEKSFYQNLDAIYKGSKRLQTMRLAAMRLTLTLFV